MRDIHESFVRGAFSLERLLKTLDPKGFTNTLDESFNHFCVSKAISDLHIDSKAFRVGKKLVTRTQLGFFRALPVFNDKQIRRCQEGSYLREADGLLHANPSLAELVVPSILRAVDERFVPETLHYEFCFVQRWIYVFVISEDRGEECLADFVFKRANRFNVAEFSRIMDGILVQCMVTLQTYQREANLTHSDLHNRNIVLRKAHFARDLTVSLGTFVKQFHLDADVPEICLIDFEFSVATWYIGSEATTNTCFTIFGSQNSFN